MTDLTDHLKLRQRVFLVRPDLHPQWFLFMAFPLRSQQIDLHRYTTYHVISRCNRQVRLLGDCAESRSRRKGVLLAQLERLARFTAVGVAGFAVMDNHIHLLLKVDADGAHRWSDREVAERWLALHPPRNSQYKRLDVEEEHIAVLCGDRAKLEACREKLTSISQFMKELKQETSQRLNKLDETVGSIWAGRFKCKAVKDEAQLLTTMAYIDLNPFAANACKTPESGDHTTLTARLHGEVEQKRVDTTATARTARSGRSGQQEHRGWWLAIDTNRNSPGTRSTAANTILPGSGLTFDGYLKLLETTARLFRKGKKRLGHDGELISDRLPVSPRSIADTVHEWITSGIPKFHRV